LNKERDQELERIREKINDVIRYSENYWMIYKKDTFGVATILDLDYKKSYIEILFFPNYDVMEKGMPIIEIYTPIETEVDFNEILIDPDFDEDGLISPTKIVERTDELIEREFQYHLSLLDEEVKLIDQRFENYPINNIPYFRKIILYFPGFSLELKANFEEYPLKPRFIFSKNLSKIIKIEKFLEFDEMKEWDELNPPHIADIIDHLINFILTRLNLVEYFKKYQLLLLEDVTTGDFIERISLKAHRGQSIGILCETTKDTFIEKVNIMKLFNAIAGKTQDFSGSVKIFGKFVQLLSKEDQARIFVLPQPIDSKIAQLKVKNAIKYNIKVRFEWSVDDKELRDKLQEAGLSNLIEEWVTKGAFWKFILYLKKIKKKRDFLKHVLKATGLKYKKNKRVEDLDALNFLRFSLARALVQAADVIMFIIPEQLFDRLKFKELKNELERIKKEFHMILLVQGPEEFVAESDCDKIITITDKKTHIGLMDELITQVPQEGEIITIELNYPTKKTLEKLFSLESVIVIEERRNEKYKIFPKTHPNQIIRKIIHLFGSELLNFEKKRCDLNDYITYLKITP
jgi:ABC-type multidrug transport system ATPase subunit